MLDFGYYNMDCMIGMKEFPDKYFDLAVVDPPYGVNYKNGAPTRRGNAKAKRSYYKDFENDSNPPDKEYFDELMRVSQKQIIWGGNHFANKLPISHCWIVWDKVYCAPSYGDCELAWTSMDGQSRMFRFCWAGMLQGDMKHKEARIHPTQKPVELYRWIFKNYTKPGQKILDTHVGSASSLIAAHDAGLNYVGFEIDEYYYKKSKQRLDEYEAQMNIFDFGVERINDNDEQ